jgi:RNA polymerase sigma factor (sigma-70 family)
MTDERSLVRAAQGGSRQAFAALVERYSRAVLARQFACTHEMSAAEDLAQETFLRAWQGLARLKESDAFGSWLLSIAGFVSMEWIRGRQSQRRHEGKLAESTRDVDAPRSGPDVPLAEAVAALADDLQQLLALRHDAGLSCEEIADQLGKPLGTVTKTLSRAYAQLRERLVKK